MNFRLAKKEDEQKIQQLYHDGSESLRARGVDQWQGEQLPNTEKLDEHIAEEEIFVLEDEGEIVGTVVVTKIEPAYAHIQGQWISEEEFFALHRVAVKGNSYRKGYGRSLFCGAEEWAKEKGIHSLRVDTHKDNLPMQNLLKQCGYTYCGEVKIGGKLLRIAFEKLV